MEKILVIDDKQDNLISANALFKVFMPECTVLTAQSGAAGISIAQTELPDTILLDIIMPEMDGYEVCSKLKHDNRTKHIPIIMLTAIKTDIESRVRGLKLGADAFLAKPIDPIELSAQVNAMLRIKIAEDKLRVEKANLEKLVSIRTAKLKESEKKYRLLVDNQTDLTVKVDLEGRFLFVSPSYCKIFGKTEKELLNNKFMPLIYEEDQEHTMKSMEALYQPPYTCHVEQRVKTMNGLRWFGWTDTAILNDQGEVVEIIGLGRDITERKQAEMALCDSKQKIERLHGIAHELEECTSEMEVYRTTIKAADSVLNFSLASLSIAEGESLVGKAFSSAMASDSQRESCPDTEKMALEIYRTGISTFLVGANQAQFQSGIIAAIKDIGVFRVYSAEKAAFSQEDMRLLELLLDHTGEAVKRIRIWKKLEEQAIHDPLTNAYNRRYFNHIIEQESSRASRYDHQIGFLMVDIDQFKQINDLYGHQIGDQVLQQVANLLIRQVRDTDIVVRYGGDEFLLVLIEPDREISMVKQRIMVAVGELNQTKSIVSFPVTLSIGMAHWKPESNKSLEGALAAADSEMYAAKKHKKYANRTM